MAGLFNPSDIYDMLQQRGILPRLSDADPYGQRGAGLFSEGKNVIVARDPSKAGFPSIAEGRTDTLAHEMTHAAQFNLLEPAFRRIQSKKIAKEKLSNEELQFADGMDKLMRENPSLASLLGKMYSSSGDSKDDKYRTSIPELQAWGVGYMSRPTYSMNREKSNINPHLNPSMATEFSILSNLYSKLPENVKKISTELRQDEIDKSRSRDREGLYKESVDLFSDPFKSTIR
jgi:hypothetical protein